MTIEEIVKVVSASIKTYSVSTFYRDVRRLKVKPLGKIRTKPQHYDSQLPTSILAARGFVNISVRSPLDTAASRLVTLPELRRERRKARAR